MIMLRLYNYQIPFVAKCSKTLNAHKIFSLKRILDMLFSASNDTLVPFSSQDFYSAARLCKNILYLCLQHAVYIEMAIP